MSLTPENVLLFNRLAGSVVFTNAQLRQPDSIARNRLGQPGLWPHSISGDLPIVLARVAAAGDESLVRQLLQWHAYTRRQGLELDLVILDQRADEAAERLRAELQTDVAAEILGKPGGIFLLDAANVPADDAVLLAAAARVVLGGGSGCFAGQDNRTSAAAPLPPRLSPRSLRAASSAQPAKQSDGLSFWNGVGGFTHDGREYVIVVDGTAPGGPALPPAPWTNVLANPEFGCLV